MVGRTPKPAELRELQGNPGRRPIVTAPADDTPVDAQRFKFVELNDDAQSAYDIIAADLKRLNFIRASDQSLLLRYAEAFARFWKITKKLDGFDSETYEITTDSGRVQRMRPEFLIQEKLAKRLEGMEASLGLSPMARQQYMLRMAQVGMQPTLFPDATDPKRETDGEDEERRAPPSSPVGFLRGNTTLQ